jgi:hypothetical protein
VLGDVGGPASASRRGCRFKIDERVLLRHKFGACICTREVPIVWQNFFASRTRNIDSMISVKTARASNVPTR